jgi:excisionase family DNA binding protein
MTNAPEYLRARNIAQLTGVSLRTVRRWIASKIVVSVKIRGARLVAKSELERLLSPSSVFDEAMNDAPTGQAQANRSRGPYGSRMGATRARIRHESSF